LEPLLRGRALSLGKCTGKPSLIGRGKNSLGLRCQMGTVGKLLKKTPGKRDQGFGGEGVGTEQEQSIGPLRGSILPRGWGRTEEKEYFRSETF